MYKVTITTGTKVHTITGDRRHCLSMLSLFPNEYYTVDLIEIETTAGWCVFRMKINLEQMWYFVCEELA